MAEKMIKPEEFFRFRLKAVKHTCRVSRCYSALRDRNSSLCQKHYMQLWRARNPIRSAYCNLRDSARRRRLAFHLSFEDFQLMVSDTPYIEYKGTTTGSYQIDRINPCRGYLPDNVRVIPISENIAKGNRERLNYEYRRELLLRKGYHVDPYDDWADDSELVCLSPSGNDPF